MLRGRVVVPFSSEAIEKKEKLSIAPSKIEIYSQQDAPLSVPATSFASCSSCLVRVSFFSAGWSMEEGREDEWISSWKRWRHSLWLHCAIEAGFLLRQLVICNQPCEYCRSLVPMLKCGGQPIIQVGLLWIPHSIEAGLWLASNVCSVAMNLILIAKWCILKLFCFVRLLATWLWALDNFTIKFWLCFAPCMCVFSIARCVYIVRFVVASFALWFCDCAILLSIPLTDDDIEILRRHIKLGNNELKRQLATNDRWAAGTEATELFSAEFHTNVAHTQNGVAKLDWFEIGLRDGSVHASAVVVLTFASVKWQEEK